MRKVRELKSVVEFKDADGRVTARKGTSCALVEHGSNRFVEKRWVSGDWVFPGEYEYQVEKLAYQQCNARGLPVPKLLEFDDGKRTLRIEHIPGAHVATPCPDERFLLPVLRFFDAFKDLAFPPSLRLHRIDENLVHMYLLGQWQRRISREQLWARTDAVFQSFLRSVPFFAVPFDGILKNVLRLDDALFFIDFEWTIAGPQEFTLARVATEFNQFDHPEVLRRVGDMNLYHFFLFRYYVRGHEPERMHRFLKRHLAHDELSAVMDLVTPVLYAGQPWCGR